jgi:hypothetical protein
MSDSEPKIPAPQVLDTFIRRFAENKEKIGAMNGDLGDRLRNQYDLNQDFNAFFWSLFKKVCYAGMTNELKSREMIRIGRLALDSAEAWMDEHGHTGDIATMAEKAAQQGDNTPKGSQPKAEEPKPAEPQAEQDATASNVVPLKGEKKPKTPKEPKAPKQAKGEKKPKDSVDRFRESLRETVSQGDEHIKSLAAGEAPTPPSELPDIPEPLDRRKERERTPNPDEADHGRYRILS